MSIKSLSEANMVIRDNKAVLIYFAGDSCNVSNAIFPKVLELQKDYFPELVIASVHLTSFPKLSAFFNAFSEPTVLVFFDGKEFIRKSRGFGIMDLKLSIERPYKLILS